MSSINVIVLLIAQLAHAINIAYCEAIGDLSQAAWDNAPDWQKKSAIAGVEMHLANPDATPEQSHESWLKQKIADGWVYGEVKDEKLKTHPCCLPYDELPAEQKAKDYLFRAAVHSAHKLALAQVEAMPKTATAPAVTSKGIGQAGIRIKYIGVRDEWTDRTYATGLHFSKDQVIAVPAHVAGKLLKHSDMFVVDGGKDTAVKEDTLQVLDEAKDQSDTKEKTEDLTYVTLNEVSKMSRDGLVQFAMERYQVKLNGRGKAEDLRAEVERLVNQYGVL